jgi:hypothetical protein
MSLSNQPVVTAQSASDLNKHEASPALWTNRHLGFLTRPTCVAGLILACVVLFSLYIRVSDYVSTKMTNGALFLGLRRPRPRCGPRPSRTLRVDQRGGHLIIFYRSGFHGLGITLPASKGSISLGFLVHTTNAFLLYRNSLLFLWALRFAVHQRIVGSLDRIGLELRRLRRAGLEKKVEL